MCIEPFDFMLAVATLARAMCAFKFCSNGGTTRRNEFERFSHVSLPPAPSSVQHGRPSVLEPEQCLLTLPGVLPQDFSFWLLAHTLERASGFCHAELGGLAVVLGGFRLVFRDAPSNVVERSYIEGCVRIALLGSLAEPEERFRVLLISDGD